MFRRDGRSGYALAETNEEKKEKRSITLHYPSLSFHILFLCHLQL